MHVGVRTEPVLTPLVRDLSSRPLAGHGPRLQALRDAVG
jgi:hypothetical protein